MGDGEKTTLPLELRKGRHMLPAQQETQEILSRHRLDLAPQTLHRVAVDASEKTPLTEFLVRARRIREPAAQREALGFQRAESNLDVPGCKSRVPCERADSGR